MSIRLKMQFEDIVIDAEIEKAPKSYLIVPPICHMHGEPVQSMDPVFDLTQYGFEQDKMITVYQCPTCSRQHGLSYEMEFGK